MCFSLTQSTSQFGACSLCATVDSLNISGNSIHYCGSGKINCSSSLTPTMSQSFDIPCIDIQNCNLLNCRNECNKRGTCTRYGMCECYSGYYGYDCSLRISDNCASSPLIDNSCWSISYPQCDIVELSKTTNPDISQVTQYSVKDFTSFPISPCKTVINEPSIKCDMCLSMENIHSEGENLVGCPSINMNCNNIPARSEVLDCITIGPTSTCPTDNPKEEPQPSSNFSASGLLFGLGLFLVILVIISLGYFLVKKFGGFGTAKPQVYVEDEEPLNENDY